MEIFVQEAEKKNKLSPQESEVLLKYSSFYKENIIIINGLVSIAFYIFVLAWLWKNIHWSEYCSYEVISPW
jgi:hypothetical protein